MTAPIIFGLDPDLQIAALLIIVSIVVFVVWWVRAIRAAGRSVRREGRHDRRPTMHATMEEPDD